jgi:catechol 2,3-dioxygenase-like lactoylglutathione lyase family enzyme
MTERIRKVARVLETAIYADDLSRAAGFYKTIFGFDALVETPRLCALDVGGSTVLLIFQRGATHEALPAHGGWIPPHDSSGPAHFAFAVEAEDLGWWEHRLAAYSVEIESRVTWERGGTSLYFRDPDNHSVELVTRGTWPTY